MTARSYSAIRTAEGRRRRRLAAAALLDLESVFTRTASRHLDASRMLVLGIDPRF